jgi:hypothetical protein
MNFTYDRHKRILIEFLKENVDFILVGGYAVIFHGYIRTTGDMDIWLKPDNENKNKVLEIFKRMGNNPDDIKKLSEMDFTGIVSFHIGVPPDRIDFMTTISGIKFNEAYERRKFLKLKGYNIPILDLYDLVANKLLSGRAKDMADVEELQKIGRMRKRNI